MFLNAGFLPRSFQGSPCDSSALVLHHHLQRGQTLHEEQAAGEGEEGRRTEGVRCTVGEHEMSCDKCMDVSLSFYLSLIPLSYQRMCFCNVCWENKCMFQEFLVESSVCVEGLF